MVDRLTSARIPISLWVPLQEIESSAIDQLRNVALLPFVEAVCAMPDIHAGVGATVGSVIVTKEAVIPAAVGVDIACGMSAVKTNLKFSSILQTEYAELRRLIESKVPTGNGPGGSHSKRYLFPQRIFSLKSKYIDFWSKFENLVESVHSLEATARAQMGTLGGGNHFIELCTDMEGFVWIMLHSGSRRIGKEIAEIYIKKAKQIAKLNKLNLPDPNLAPLYTGTSEFDSYIHDALWAQDYARWNRLFMLTAVQDVLETRYPEISFEESVNCHHNYLQTADNLYITRKGAIEVKENQLGIIPGSMGTRSYIVRGLGCIESFCSASHGAGRKMSRSEARRQFTLEDVLSQTAQVECRKDSGILDELPGAYKDIDQVMEYQKDLVEIQHTLKQFICVKG